jgi:hypothetical protein
MKKMPANPLSGKKIVVLWGIAALLASSFVGCGYNRYAPEFTNYDRQMVPQEEEYYGGYYGGVPTRHARPFHFADDPQVDVTVYRGYGDKARTDRYTWEKGGFRRDR